MKLTKAISISFFNLIKEEKTDTFEESMDLLRQYPELANGIVSGMAKGIDGFSSLMLSIRFYNFNIAIELIKAGADVNYIDNSPARENHEPVFFDLLEMIKNLIEVRKTEDVKTGLEVWNTMIDHGLDYSQKSICNDGVNEPENCLEAFIRIASTRYGSKHRVHYYVKPEPFERIYELNEKSRDLEKEKWYGLMMEKLINEIPEKLMKEIKPDRQRYSEIYQTSPGNYEIINDFSLDLADQHVRRRFGYSLKNIDDDSHLDDLKTYAKKTFR